MLFKNIVRIITGHKLSLLQLIFYEIIYIFKGFKGNRISFSKNSKMSDNIPYPFFFLVKIKKTLSLANFTKFIDLGCGSGRVINFFNKNFPNKNFIGIEYFSSQYNYCKKIFAKNSNIKIYQEDFTKIDFLQYNADCFFFNNPWRNEDDPFDYILNMSKSLSDKTYLIILVNYSKKFCEKLNDTLKNSKCIDSYYIKHNKGYHILELNSVR